MYFGPSFTIRLKSSSLPAVPQSVDDGGNNLLVRLLVAAGVFRPWLSANL